MGYSWKWGSADSKFAPPSKCNWLHFLCEKRRRRGEKAMDSGEIRSIGVKTWTLVKRNVGSDSWIKFDGGMGLDSSSPPAHLILLEDVSISPMIVAQGDEGFEALSCNHGYWADADLYTVTILCNPWLPTPSQTSLCPTKNTDGGIYTSGILHIITFFFLPLG